MKHMVLQAQADLDNPEDVLDDAEVLRLVCRSPLNPQAGADLEELDRGLRLVRALHGKAAGDCLELEDADWLHLCEKVRAFRWAIVDPRISRLCHRVLEAE